MDDVDRNQAQIEALLAVTQELAEARPDTGIAVAKIVLARAELLLEETERLVRDQA